MLYKCNIGPLRYKNYFEVILYKNLINWRYRVIKLSVAYLQHRPGEVKSLLIVFFICDRRRAVDHLHIVDVVSLSMLH